MRERKITITTNTAYLLNTWFQDKTFMFPTVKPFLEQIHKEMWKTKNDGFIEVTFKKKRKGDARLTREEWIKYLDEEYNGYGSVLLDDKDCKELIELLKKGVA